MVRKKRKPTKNQLDLNAMTASSLRMISEEITAALRGRQPVVALESTVIAHGLAWPLNLEMARRMETTIRQEGAIPATIAVWQGQPAIGLSESQLEFLARGSDILKASRRDLALAATQKKTAATTVAATLFLAHQAGIRVFATGGIGGAHRDASQPWDISADLFELARVPVAVVCAGAKSILDIPRTLEILETFSVPVLGYRTDTFPAFYLRSSGEPVLARFDSAPEIAGLLQAHWALGGAGVVVAQPIEPESALGEAEWAPALEQAEASAARQGIRRAMDQKNLLPDFSAQARGQCFHIIYRGHHRGVREVLRIDRGEFSHE
jgi:pseudouridine-5'-phosphate glycosidase